MEVLRVVCTLLLVTGSVLSRPSVERFRRETTRTDGSEHGRRLARPLDKGSHHAAGAGYPAQNSPIQGALPSMPHRRFGETPLPQQSSQPTFSPQSSNPMGLRAPMPPMSPQGPLGPMGQMPPMGPLGFQGPQMGPGAMGPMGFQAPMGQGSMMPPPPPNAFPGMPGSADNDTNTPMMVMTPMGPMMVPAPGMNNPNITQNQPGMPSLQQMQQIQQMQQMMMMAEMARRAEMGARDMQMGPFGPMGSPNPMELGPKGLDKAGKGGEQGTKKTGAKSKPKSFRELIKAAMNKKKSEDTSSFMPSPPGFLPMMSPAMPRMSMPSPMSLTGMPPQMSQMDVPSKMPPNGMPPQMGMSPMMPMGMPSKMPPTGMPPQMGMSPLMPMGMPPQMSQMGMPSKMPQTGMPTQMGMSPLMPMGMPPQMSQMGMPSKMPPTKMPQIGMPPQMPQMGMPSQMSVTGIPPQIGMPPQMSHLGMPPQMSQIRMPPQMEMSPDMPQIQMPSQMAEGGFSPMGMESPSMFPLRMAPGMGLPQNAELPQQPELEIQGDAEGPAIMGLPRRQPLVIPDSRQQPASARFPLPLPTSHLPPHLTGRAEDNGNPAMGLMAAQSLPVPINGVPGPVQLPVKDLKSLMTLEYNLQHVRSVLLSSFYADIAAYRTMTQLIQQRMMAKLAMIQAVEARMAMPLRGTVAMGISPPAYTG